MQLDEMLRTQVWTVLTAALLLPVSGTVAAELRLRASVDESRVVRPGMFQPPVIGTGSPGVGMAHLVVDPDTSTFSFDIAIQGITPGDIESSIGANFTGLHIHTGAPDMRGPIIIDVHHYAREALPATNGIVEIPGGFRMHAEGVLTQVQGFEDTGLTISEIVEILSTPDAAFVAVHTSENDLTKTGAIRGNFDIEPEFRVRAAVDESQVVRPGPFQPPIFGTGSPGAGAAHLVIYPGARFSFDIEIDGVTPADIESSIGSNLTGLHVHAGPPDMRGPIIIDVHYYAREALPESNGLVDTTAGFRMHAEGTLGQMQGLEDTGLTAEEIVNILRTPDAAFVAVHTSDNDLTKTGAIRGNFMIEAEIRLRTSVDESQVVRPGPFQPPVFGTGSPGVGDAFLEVNPVTGNFTFDIEIDGVTPEDIDSSIGANLTGLHIHKGFSDVRGPIIIDVHYYARQALPETNGLTAIANGFRMHAEGTLAQMQGLEDTGLTVEEMVNILWTPEAFVAVHTSENDLTKTGAIRGNFSVVSPAHFTRGDCNGDGERDISDAIFSLDHLFTGGSAPDCNEACNSNNSDAHDIADAIHLLGFLFQGTASPTHPFPFCDVDFEWQQSLGCERTTCNS
jgi:hypothetical protein